MSDKAVDLAESICLLFGKAYKPQGDPDMGGIGDKVLSDVIGCIVTMLRAHYGPMEAAQDALRDAIADARSNADALQHAEIQLAQSVCAEEHRQVMAERDEARNALVAEGDAHFLRVQELEKERDAPEGLRDQLGGAERRIVELTQERDAAFVDGKRMMAERDAAILKANILADSAFHDGKERARLTDWTTELRAQVSALTVERDEARANAAAFCGENERLRAAAVAAIKMPPSRSNLPRYVVDMANVLAAALAAPKKEKP